ncbi:hypothetical protein TSUD_13350 [Trifolium subterraneum]|uniref:Pentacotripeptide-repeat region of PRORP domain-containing protein n=1 Tax=Trifolium subterraneum TaxID=3900 RepID=A0A2Z6PFK9_TRISU|nr:hypothetical protein TSUD_13350 [Trifolium subterraneum]
MCSHLRIFNKGVSFLSEQQHQQQLELVHKITQNLINSSNLNYFKPNNTELHSIISCITPHVTYCVLSDRILQPHSCLAFFHFLRTQHSNISLKPDLKAHLILISRLFEARKFASMKRILNGLVTDLEIRCPVSGIVDLVDEFEPHFVEKLFDMLFRVCSDNRLFEEAIRVYDYAEEKGLVIEERSCFVLLLALKRCGEVDMCLRFFRRMVESDSIEIRVQSLTLVIDGLCRNGEVEKAKGLMDELTSKGMVKPTVFTYNTLLNAYVGRKDEKGFDEILGLMEKERVVYSVATYSILIQWYSSSGNIGEAEKIFEEMRERNMAMDVYVYSSMISWNCRLGNMKRAFALFDEMAQRDIAPNAHTYGALIGGVCKEGQMEAAEILLEEMQSKGLDLNLVIFNTMIDGYCKRGMMDEALKLQEIMEKKGLNADVFTYNILANGLCKLHRVDDALTLFNEMGLKGITGNVATYTSIISGLSKEGRADEAFNLYDEMMKMGLTPDDRVFAALVGSLHKPAILAEEERLIVIRFGHDWDETCMQMDEVLSSVAKATKNFAVDITEVPDFNTMYEGQTGVH